jgi:zinc transport system ATP-binding protein
MNRAQKPLLEVAGLRLDLGGRRILEDVSLTLAEGEFLGLIGPNGGGKTSLLRVLLGLHMPTTGTVRWHPRPGGPPRIGYVPQRTNVDRNYPLSALEVLRQGAPGGAARWGEARRSMHRDSGRLLRKVGLATQGDTRFVNLSGGQQQRLLLARALMTAPEVLLLDEPTAGLDTDGQQQFGTLLHQLNQEGVAIVLVSHDIPLVQGHAQRIACLNRTLHWHGRTAELDQQVINRAFFCELEKFRAQPSPEPQALEVVER